MSLEISTSEQIHHAKKTYLGFWVYLMTDLIMFAALFATYAVLRNNTAGGPNGDTLFNLHFVLAETMILLFSSFSCGIAVLLAEAGKKISSLFWLSVTFLLGLSFLIMEVIEFFNLAKEGQTPDKNAFLSSFFTLLGAHGLHIFFGLVWLAVIFVFIYKKGLTPKILSNITRFGMFWHFLDLVWIFIFTIVYLMK